MTLTPSTASSSASIIIVGDLGKVDIPAISSETSADLNPS
jgi:hypothetical protein